MSKGGSEGGKLQGRCAEEDTGQYVRRIKQPTTRPLPLRLWLYKYKIVNWYINSVF